MTRMHRHGVASPDAEDVVYDFADAYLDITHDEVGVVDDVVREGSKEAYWAWRVKRGTHVYFSFPSDSTAKD